MTLLSLGWRHGSQGLPRIPNEHNPQRIPRARLEKDYPTNATHEKLLEQPQGSKYPRSGIRPRDKGELRSSHNSCSRSHDLGGSCSGLGPSWPKSKNEGPIQATLQGARTQRFPPARRPEAAAVPAVPANMVSPTTGTPARAQLEHPPRRADYDRYSIT